MGCWVPNCTAAKGGQALCHEHWLLVPKPLRFEYEQAWNAAHGFSRFGMTARGYLALRDCIASALILTGQQTVEDVIEERELWVRIAAGYDEQRAERTLKRQSKAGQDED